MNNELPFDFSQLPGNFLFVLHFIYIFLNADSDRKLRKTWTGFTGLHGNNISCHIIPRIYAIYVSWVIEKGDKI